MFISLSPWTSVQFFTPSRLSRASDLSFVWFACFVTRFINCWCNIFQSESLLQCFFHEMAFLSMAKKFHREAWPMQRWKSRQMCQINSNKIYLFFVLLISPKIWHVHYRKVVFKGNVQAVPKNCVRYNKCPLWKCPLYRGFSMRVWPWSRRFHEKMSAIDKFDCSTIRNNSISLVNWKIKLLSDFQLLYV